MRYNHIMRLLRVFYWDVYLAAAGEIRLGCLIPRNIEWLTESVEPSLKCAFNSVQNEEFYTAESLILLSKGKMFNK